MAATAWLTSLRSSPRPKASSRLEGLQSHGGPDLDLQQGVGVVGRDLLDLDTPFGGGNHPDAFDLSIEHEAQVQLARERLGLFHVDAVHELALGAGLGRHERLADQGARGVGHLMVGTAEAHAARLAAPARVDLRLDRPVSAAELCRHVHGVIGAVGDPSRRYRNAELGEQFLCLVFMDVHTVTRCWGVPAAQRSILSAS